MTEAELVRKSGELVQELIGKVRTTTTVPAEQRSLALLIISRMLGSAYATDLDRHGADRAREWVAQLFAVATSYAQMVGADPDFSFAIIEKKKETPQ